MYGLMVRSPWIELLLNGSKTWEIRGMNTNLRGIIALIKSGSGKVWGTCEIIDVKGPLTIDDMLKNTIKHCELLDGFEYKMPYKKTFAWVISNPKPLKNRISYVHPSGAITWVRLPDSMLFNEFSHPHYEKQLSLFENLRNI